MKSGVNEGVGAHRPAGFMKSSLTLWQKRLKVEAEIENWMQKYDADMGEKQVETPTCCTSRDVAS